MAASRPRWWSEDMCILIVRAHMTIKNSLPMITWSPWNPVATKNVEPYTESAIVNLASMYSIACSRVKYRPRQIVVKRP